MLISRDFTFDAAHRLEGYKGKCESLHGHTWKLRVTLSAEINETGMAFDFVELKKIVEEKVIVILDHSYLNELLPQPTTENIANWVWNKLENILPIYEIKVWESESCFVTLKKPEQA